MTYRRPYPWTPMHPNVPMLGEGPQLGASQLFLVAAAIVAGLALASWAAEPRTARNPRRRRRRRPRRTSRARRRTSKNALSAAQRRRIPRRDFVFPDRRAWPLDTERRARAAISALQMGRVRNASDYNAIRNKLIKLWPRVWKEYGRGKVSWPKTKRAKARRRRRTRRRRRAA